MKLFTRENTDRRRGCDLPKETANKQGRPQSPLTAEALSQAAPGFPRADYFWSHFFPGRKHCRFCLVNSSQVFVNKPASSSVWKTFLLGKARHEVKQTGQGKTLASQICQLTQVRGKQKECGSQFLSPRPPVAGQRGREGTCPRLQGEERPDTRCLE